MDATATPAATTPQTDNASVGLRVGGLLLDTLVVGVPLAIVIGLLLGEAEAGSDRVSLELGAGPTLVLVAAVLVYFFLAESFGGQTLGKKVVGTKVVAADGGRVGAGAVAVRTALRIVDGFAFYLVGFVVALVSKDNQRVGDMVARTRVVRSR